MSDYPERPAVPATVTTGTYDPFGETFQNFHHVRLATGDVRFGTEPDYTARVWARMKRSEEALFKPKPQGVPKVEIIRPEFPMDHVFKTQAELFAAQSDPRFQKDFQYTQWVWQCMENSRATLWPREVR